MIQDIEINIPGCPQLVGDFRNSLAASPMQSGKTPPKGIGDVLVRNPGPGKISRVSVLYTEHVKERGGSFRKELGSCTRIPLYLPFFLSLQRSFYMLSLEQSS